MVRAEKAGLVAWAAEVLVEALVVVLGLGAVKVAVPVAARAGLVAA